MPMDENEIIILMDSFYLWFFFNAKFLVAPLQWLTKKNGLVTLTQRQFGHNLLNIIDVVTI